eukprot:TRINITY_DN6432_c0_g1_i1.p1 TRINITY_DN6432_c0_g1~~TRINITY_DN6432_c0_g1_i1.p1  ORF type:complete len:135 (+),score=22.92 TRINITY_DN6432_c0_g1_i1:721-1125(+)
MTPFQYFGLDDDIDLSKVSWRGGRYDISELSNLYTGENNRANRIISSLADIVTNVHDIKALAFCVSQDHAEFMAAKFNLKGINADVLTSKNTNERAQKQQALRQGEIQILCVVDIFNEGSYSEVDTSYFKADEV